MRNLKDICRKSEGTFVAPYVSTGRRFGPSGAYAEMGRQSEILKRAISGAQEDPFGFPNGLLWPDGGILEKECDIHRVSCECLNSAVNPACGAAKISYYDP